MENLGCQNFFSYNLNIRDTSSKIKTLDAILKELLGVWAKVGPEITSKDHFLDQ